MTKRVGYIMGERIFVDNEGVPMHKVLITTYDASGVPERTQNIVLPEPAAVSLVESMDDTSPVYRTAPNGWIEGADGTLARMLKRLRTVVRTNAWLSYPSLKYLSVRIDLRDGRFTVNDAFDRDALHTVAVLTGGTIAK